MKKIDVCHIFSKMDRGGMETFVMNLYRAIDRKRIKFNFIVFTDEKGSYDNEILELGGEIFVLPDPSDNLRIYIKELYEFLKEKQFDVVHSHLHYFSGVNLNIAKKAGIKIRVAHSHTTSDGVKSTFIRELYRKYMVNMIKGSATNMLACGEEAAKALYGTLDDNRIEIIHNGIDLNRFMNNKLSKDQCKEMLNLPKDAFVIGNVARFRPEKNHEFLIDIFNYIQREHDNVYMVLVGDGELKEDIEKKAKNLSIDDKIKFLGGRSDVENILKALDVFILPSIYEGLGMVVIEAQAAGIRSVVSDTVPKEVDLTGNVEFVSLDKDLETWGEKIMDNRMLMDVTDKMYSYDINSIAKNMEQIYMGQVKN